MTTVNKTDLFLQAAATLVTVLGGIGIFLTLPGGCMAFLMIPVLLLSALLLIVLTGLPLLYRRICGIPSTAALKRQAWIAIAVMAAWICALALADMTGAGRCIS
jgi:hypothetical protein